MKQTLMIAMLLGTLLAGTACKRTDGADAGVASAAERSSGGEAGAEAGADEDQLICRKEHVIGSHRRQTVCRYKREMRRERESVKQGLRSTNASAPPPLE